MTGRLLLRNSGWNLLGQLLPFLAAVIAIPVLLHQLGVERLGILLLAWIVAGTSSPFDLGLGRATTKLVAEVPIGDSNRLATVVRASLALTTFVGAAASLILIALGPSMATGGWLSIPAQLRTEAVAGVRVLALAIPLVTASASLRGILEARQRFDLVNYVRAPAGILTYLGPMSMALVSPTLPAAMMGLLAARAITVVAYGLTSKAVAPNLRSSRVDIRSMLQVARYGAWLSVSGVVGPAVAQLDKFVIGSLLSVAAVAYYASPFEVATKVWVFPGALAAVLFAAFSGLSPGRDIQPAQLIFERGFRYLFLPLLIVTAAIVAVGPWAIGLWLGQDFAIRSGPVLQILAIGVFANSLAYIPTVFIQASGRPDLTAKLYFLELIPYIVLLWTATRSAGIEGAAVAWALRCFADAVALYYLAGIRLNWTGADARRLIARASVATIYLLSVLFLKPLLAPATYAVLVIAGALLVLWATVRQSSSIRLDKVGKPSGDPISSSVTCPICGAKGRKSMDGLSDRVYGAEGSWSLMQCQSSSCELSWLEPMPRPEERADFYRHYYTHPAEAAGEGVRARPRLLEQLEDQALRKLGYSVATHERFDWHSVLAAMHPGGSAELTAQVLYLKAPRGANRVLDVGCGNGDLMARLNALGWCATGVDPDPLAVSQALSRGLDAHVGTLADQNYPNDHFDAVVSAHVIEHMDQPTQFMQESSRILKPGGTLIVVTPNGKSLCRRLFGSAWSSLDPPRHLMLHTPKSLRSAAEQANLHVSACGSTVRYARSIAVLSLRLWRRGQLRGDDSVSGHLQGFAVPLQLLERMLISIGVQCGEELRLIAAKGQE
jgi:O-antigen/teichoic acid export membrane protein/2-polyprenyl-3-methyl-5-hydroxy-6-metoxy-1,4-benzoquinol methylase